MASVRSAVRPDFESDYVDIERYYRDTLAKITPPTGLRWEPVKIGPTWQWVDGWVLPELTLGWRVLAWCGVWLKDRLGQPWQFTAEQARFLLWFYALDEWGRWQYHSAVLQRLKGWGKDPVLATVAMAACFGPVKFSHFDGDQPVGVEDPSAWVQIVGVAQEQTKNTMKLFPSLITEDCKRRYGIQVGRQNVWGLNDTVQIEAITSNPLTVEGGRPTLIGRNETQNWNASNQGHDMAGALEGNIAKSERGAARILDVCNAYRPGDDSVGERAREAWETARANNIDIGVLYDSLEAPPDAPLTLEAAPEVVAAIAGDSYWLDVASDGRIVKSIANTQNPASESRRKWYNQITATADAWMTPQLWDVCGGQVDVAVGEPVVLFFDGSKSDDATALVGCRLSDGAVFTVGVWAKPPRAAKGWLVDRASVDHRVAECFTLWDVHGLWADLSDARDDETGERYWEPYADRWAREHEWELSRLAAVKTGPYQHLVNWDMRNPRHLMLFTEYAERFTSDVSDGLLVHDGHKVLRQHVLNARRRPNKFGIGLSKEHRESARKIDLAVCAVGARMMWHLLNGQTSSGRVPGQGRVITFA